MSRKRGKAEDPATESVTEVFAHLSARCAVVLERAGLSSDPREAEKVLRHLGFDPGNEASKDAVEKTPEGLAASCLLTIRMALMFIKWHNAALAAATTLMAADLYERLVAKQTGIDPELLRLRGEKELEYAGSLKGAERKKAATRPRHAEVRRLSAEGYKTKDIALMAGYDESTVRKIVNKRPKPTK